MTVLPIWRKGTLAALVVLLACVPQVAPNPPVFSGSPLPSGPLVDISVQAIRALAQQVQWQECMRRVRGGNPARTTTPVVICAASYARDVGNPSTNARGIMVARMINEGAVKERRFGMSPSDTSFIVSFPGTSSSGIYAVIEIPNNSMASTKIRVLQSNKMFVYCGHTQGTESKADFRTCKEGPTRAAAGSEEFAGTRASGPRANTDLALSSLDGPAWVSCISGCCTTEAQ